MSIAYLNGEFIPLSDAKVSVLDRGFLFADGVYEVIPVYAGKPFRLAEHLTRLQYSLSSIKLNAHIDDEAWEQIITQLIEKNNSQHQSIYLQITRGAAEKRDHAFPDESVKPTVFVMSMPMTMIKQIDPATVTGYKAITLPDIRWQRCNIKSISLLPNILLREQAIESGTQEAILIHDDCVTEGAATNVFIVMDGMPITPPKGPHILGGITRDLLIEIMQQEQITYQEKTITESMLINADEIWLTSSTKEIIPVIELDNKLVGGGKPGPVWLKVFQHYQQYKQQLFIQ